MEKIKVEENKINRYLGNYWSVEWVGRNECDIMADFYIKQRMIHI